MEMAVAYAGNSTTIQEMFKREAEYSTTKFSRQAFLHNTLGCIYIAWCHLSPNIFGILICKILKFLFLGQAEKAIIMATKMNDDAAMLVGVVITSSCKRCRS